MALSFVDHRRGSATSTPGSRRSVTSASILSIMAQGGRGWARTSDLPRVMSPTCEAAEIAIDLWFMCTYALHAAH